VNYTTKTQFLFRINKGQLDAWDNSKINAFVAKDERPVPFTRMIYIGDGETDIPCMKLVKDQGGCSIAVYPPRRKAKKDTARKLQSEDRVNFVALADYSANSLIDKQVKAVIRKMMAEHVILTLPGSVQPQKRPDVSPEPEDTMMATSEALADPVVPMQIVTTPATSASANG
jgi:hypothetical protein